MLVCIEGRWFNPDNVCIVRYADPNTVGFHTEVVMEDCVQLLTSSIEDVVKALNGTD